MIHRKNTSALIDRLILSYGIVILILFSSVPRTQTVPQCYGNVDLIFVVDASYSVSDQDFIQTVNFIGNVVAYMKLSIASNLRVGMIPYAEYVYEDLIHLIDDQSNVVSRILNQERDSSNQLTNTAGGLEAMLQMFQSEGCDKNTECTYISVLITDGVSTDPTATQAIATQIELSLLDVHLLPIGIGIDQENVDINELNIIATSDAEAIIVMSLADDSEFHLGFSKDLCVFTIDFKANPIIPKYEREFDIYFLVDESSYVLPIDFDIIMTYIKGVLTAFEISDTSGEMWARVALLKYGTIVKTGSLHTVNIAELNVEADLFTKIDGLYLNTFNNEHHNIYEGLVQVDAMMQVHSIQGRKVIIVLITGGLATNSNGQVDSSAAITKAITLQNTVENVYVLVVGAGPESVAWKSERDSMAFTDEMSIHYNSFVPLGETAAIDTLRNLVYRIAEDEFLPPTDPGTPTEWTEEFDIIFMIDGSTKTASASAFIFLKFLVRTLIEDEDYRFALSDTTGRVGVMVFDADGVYQIISLGDYTDREDLVNKIDGLQKFERTAMADNAVALAQMRAHFSEFSNLRRSAARIAYLITTSPSDYELLTIAEARAAAYAGIQLMVLGIDIPTLPPVDHDELNSLVVFQDSVPSVQFKTLSNAPSTASLVSYSAALQHFAGIQRPTGTTVIWDTGFDLVVLLHDASGEPAGNLDAKRFLLELLANRHVVGTGTDEVQVGVITFGADVNSGSNRRIQLAADTSMDTLTVKLLSLDLTPTGGPNIDAAIDDMLAMFTNNGRPRVALLMIQGNPQDFTTPAQMEAIEQTLSDNEVLMFTVGLGGETDINVLQQLAYNQYLTTQTFGDWISLDVTPKLDAGIVALATGAIDEGTTGNVLSLTRICGSEAGIVFLVDVSESMTDVFAQVKDFVKILMSGFNYDKVEVGVIGFSSAVRPDMVIELGQYNNYVQLVLEFDAIVTVDTAFAPLNDGTTDALEKMRTMFAGKTYEKMAVFVSDGKLFDPIPASQAASVARSEGIRIAAIGVGSSVFRPGLLDITGHDKYIFELTAAELTDPVQLEIVQDLLCNWADPQECSIPMDLVFVVDATSSIGDDNFRLLKITLLALINRLAIGTDQTHIGLVKIGEDVITAEALYLTDSELSVQTKILLLTGNELVTDTARALETMLSIFVDTGRDYELFPHIAVVFTDGKSSSPFQTKLQSAKAQQAGVYMIAVGMGTNILLSEMTAIASDPQNSLLLFDTFGELEYYSLHQDICEAASQYEPPTEPEPPTLTGDCQTNMDMVFLLDASESVLYFPMILAFLTKFAESLNGQGMDIGLEKIRMGIIAYSNEVHTSEIFGLDQSVNLDAVTDSILLQEQPVPSVSGTVTHLALQTMRQMFADEGRPNTPFVCVVITDGGFNSGNDLIDMKTQALLALGEGIHTVAVGFGAVSTQALYYMATDPASVRILSNEAALLNDAFTEDLLHLACASGYTCTAPMNLMVIWDLVSGEAIARANRFIEDLTQTFTMSMVNNFFVDDVQSVDLVFPAILTLMDASTDSGITQALLIITDKELSTTVKSSLVTETDKVKDRGGIVAVVDAASVANDLQVSSSEDLYFKISMFDIMPYTLVIKRSLCIRSCVSGYQLDTDSAICEECPLDTYRDALVDGKFCVDCPGGQTTETPVTTDVNDCLVGRCTDPMDIVIVIDASSSISPAEFNLVQATLVNLVAELDISPTRTRVALVPFSTDVLSPQVFDLERSTNKDDVIQAVREMEQTLLGTTNTAKAIDVARVIFLTQGRRVSASLSDIPYTMLVITDGRSDNPYRTIEEADIAKRNFIRILAIGVGRNVFRYEVESIASDESSVMFINSFIELFVANIIGPLCEDVFTCPSATLNINVFFNSAASAAFKTNANTFYDKVATDFTGATLVQQEYTGTPDFVSRLDSIGLAVDTNPENAKVVVIIADADIPDQTVKDSVTLLRELGVVVVVIDAGVAIGNTNFLQLVSNDNLLFETQASYRYIERSLCIAPCVSGYERDIEGRCVECEIGLYRVATDDHNCQSCAVGFTTSASGATTETDCVRDCGPGTFNSGTSCDPCDIGEYQALSFQTDCDSCVAGQTTMATGSTSSTDCIANCGAGMYRAADESGCLPCPENTYQPDTLQTDCIRCPVNLIAPPGSDNLVDCVGRCPTDMDIVFLVDASTSINNGEFNLVIIFLINTISNFVVGIDDTRFGIIEFADDVLLSPRLDLDDSTDREVAIQAARTLIQGVVPGTNTAAGFQAANQMLANQGRDDIAHHIIVITDGKSDNFLQTVQQANEAKMSFRSITSVGVGDRIFERELREIATDASSFIKVDSFFSLLTTDILDDICIDTFTCPEQMDLYIIRHVDSAENGNIDTFLTSLQDSYTMVNTEDVDSGATTDKLTADLAAVPVSTGVTSRAKVVVIFTDKPTAETGVDAAAQSLMDAGYVISVIYIDVATADSSSFDGIRTSESLMFQTENFYMLPYNQFIIRSLCIAPCPAGEERVVSGTCTPCEVGWYRDATQSHVCVPCPITGQYTLDTGSTSATDCLPTTCDANEFTCANNDVCVPMTDTCCVPSGDRCDGTQECSDMSDESGCNFCTAGQYFDTPTEMCVDCVRGTYQPTAKSTSCLRCPDGTTTAAAKTTASTDCSVICDVSGKELVVSDGTCTSCPKGSYRDKDIHARCVPCRDQFTTPAAMAVSQSQCVPDCPGGQRWNTVLDTCVDCLPGEYQPAQYQYDCLQCPDGTTSTAGSSSDSQCTDPCAAGSELPPGGTSVADCVLCEVGTYKDGTGTSTTCVTCPGGWTTAGPGATDDTYCIPPCIAGQKLDSVTNQCVDCSLKTYQDEDHQTSCKPCPDGKTTTVAGANSVADCTDICAAGSELPASGTVIQDCVPCEPGFYKDNSGTASTCQPCASGYTTEAPGSTTETACIRNCPAGTRIEGVACVQCAIGFYQPDVRQTACIDCGTGRSTVSEGSTSVTQCIDVCNSGSELLQRDPLQCSFCDVDTYRVKDEQLTCVDCPDNHITVDVGATSLAECLPDCAMGERYDVATLSCQSCTAGTFQPLKYQDSCIDCPTGHTTRTAGATSLSECVYNCQGGSRWEPALGRCVPCTVNEYQPLQYQAACLPCPDGTTTEIEGSTSLNDCNDPCVPGEVYNPAVGLGDPSFPRCDTCPRDTYKGTGDSTCQACTEGYITDSTGSTSISACKPPCVGGTYWDGSSLSCRPCAVGTYQAAPYQTSCLDCPAGTSTPGPGSTDLAQCIVPTCNEATEWECDSGPQCITLGNDCDGTLHCGDGSDETDINCCDDGEARSAGGTCDQCPAGTYRTRRVHTTCQDCPPDFTTIDPGQASQASCIPNCVAGYRYNGAACVPCPIGTYQALPYQTSCTDCSAGLTTTNSGSTSASLCIDTCASGTERLSPTGTCTPCPKGSYRTQNADALCVTCPNSQTTVADGSGTSVADCVPDCSPGTFSDGSACTPCVRGQYQPQPYQDSCRPCPSGRNTVDPGADTQALCIDPCSSGLEYNAQTDDCDVCPAGTYREQNVDVACTSCPDVLTTLLPGAHTVDYCIPSCTEGHFYNAAGPSCDNCLPGTYQDQQHQTACIPCPPGTFSSTQGATQASQCLDPCEPGEELIADGQGTNCQPCPLGYFKTATDILCQICTPAGFTTAATRAVDASECVPPCTYGYEWNGVVCAPCNYGTYQENQYSYACVDCDVGLSTADLGSDNQDDCIDICPSGLDLQFNRECLACKKNYYRTQFVHRQCQACPGNFFTIFDGATSLDQCLPMCDILGTHWDEATGQCILCAVGYYQDERYQTMCKSCGTGRTTVNVARTDKVTGATSISQCAGDCVEGMKWDGTSCVLCERDTYQDKPYRDVCKACLPGYITVDTGSTSAADCIDPCENGRTWDGSTCVPCGLNQFRDRDIHNLCQECDPGFITDTTTAMSEAECKPDCPEGTSWSGVLQVCIPCSVGFYQPERYQYSCMECPPTMTTTAPGAIVCVSTGCNAGEFRCVAGTPQCILEALLCDGDPTGTPDCADSSDEVNCNLCPAGQEYADASSMCVVCPIGTYKATASTEPCTTCPTGFTTANTESTSLSDCQPDCAEGYRYDVVTGVCVSCPTGTYQDLPYQYTCIPCMAGKTTTAPMSTSNSDCIDICNAGKELAADGVSCVDCVTGWYKGASGLATCQRCSDGFTTEGPGATQCIPACPPGQRRNSADTGCVVCEMGTYQDEGLQTSCKTCPAGTSTHTAGATTCHDVCSDGFELQTDGTCLPCPRGTYRTMMTDLSKVQAACIACDTGYTTETIGQPSADRCVPNCAPGSMYDASVTSDPPCSPCPQGQYQNLAYQATCKLCPVWKTTAAPGAEGADDANDCYDPCDSGVEYVAVTGLCSRNCLRGQYRQKDVDAVCVPCDPGLTTVTVRSGSPDDCVPNCSEGEEFYAITGVPECRICGVNTHQPTPYSFTCIDCDGDRPISPPVTGVLTAADRVLCIGNCAPGEMWNYVTELCNWCNLGFYGAHAGQITCTACPTDMTTLERFSTSINACIPDCSENEYWNVGSQTCDACPTTQFQPAVRPHAETSCNNNPCTAGTRYDMPVCVPCTGATYQPQSGQMQCLTCPASAPLSSSDGTKCKVSCTSGMMWLSTSATTGSCQPCPAGQHQPSAGADACIPCPQAWYQNEVGKTMCKMCPNNWHTRSTGADSVNDCQADWCTAGNIYQTATATCVPCGYGYYRRPQVDATCIQCPAGKTTTSPTASSPASCVASCPAGRYWNKWRNTCCRCPKGFYQPQPGQASCQPCPSGKTTKRVGCTTVLACYDPCRSGYQYMDCKCLPCPGGLYKKRSVSSTCVACPPDTTTFVEGATDISKCTAVPCTQCIDLVIAVDMSRSLTKLEFYAVRHYLQSFVQKFRVSRLCTRIGIYAYAGGLRKIRQLHEGVNQRQLSYHLMKSLTPSDSSEVNTELALQKMKAMIIDEGRSSGVPKHGLLITDGGTNDVPAAQTVADMLRNMGINLSVISANPSEIALAAQSSEFYHITDYLHLTPIQNIVQGICGG